jgi:hypothetical protein
VHLPREQRADCRDSHHPQPDHHPYCRNGEHDAAIGFSHRLLCALPAGAGDGVGRLPDPLLV